MRMSYNFMATVIFRMIFIFTILSKISGIRPDFFLISGKSNIRADRKNHYLVHPYAYFLDPGQRSDEVNK